MINRARFKLNGTQNCTAARSSMKWHDKSIKKICIIQILFWNIYHENSSPRMRSLLGGPLVSRN